MRPQWIDCQARTPSVPATVRHSLSSFRDALFARTRNPEEFQLRLDSGFAREERAPRNDGALELKLYLPRSFSSTSDEANPSAGVPIEAWKPRSASRVMPPSWPSGVPR